MPLTGAIQRPPFAGDSGGVAPGKSRAFPAYWLFLMTTVELASPEIAASTLRSTRRDAGYICRLRQDALSSRRPTLRWQPC
jgi:hypothetical protein